MFNRTRVAAAVFVLTLLLSGNAMHAQKVYWVDWNSIRRADLDGSNVETVIRRHFVQQVALDPAGNTMYWTDGPGNAIYRAKMDGSDLEAIITRGPVAPFAIAVDPTAGKLYWTVYNGVYRANIDGSQVEPLVVSNERKPRAPKGIALDRGRGKMYWTVRLPPSVRRANLDGSEVEDLIVMDNGSPAGIAIDIDSQKLYWTDVSHRAIYRANLDGSEVQSVIATSGVRQSVSLALDLNAGKLCWSVPYLYGPALFERCNFDGSGLESFGPETNGSESYLRAMGLAIDPLQGHLYWTDLIGTTIRRFSLATSTTEIVVTTPLAFGGHLALNVDEATMYWNSSSKLQTANLDGSDARVIPTPALPRIGSFALDTAARRIYWTESWPNGKIGRADLDGNNADDVLTRHIASTVPIAIDESQERVYWPDSPSVIRFADLNSAHVQMFVETGTSYSQVGGIVSDPVTRDVFWTGTRQMGSQWEGVILRSSADGRPTETFFSSKTIYPIGLAIDSERQMLYWTATEHVDGASQGVIQRSGLNNTDVEDVLPSRQFGPRAVALDGPRGKLYWVDAGAKKIQRSELDGTHVEDVADCSYSTHLAIDFSGERLYWTEQDPRTHRSRIRRAALDGSNSADVYRTPGISELSGFAIHATSGTMYWIADRPVRMQRANLDGTQLEDFVTNPIVAPVGIAVDERRGKIVWSDSSTSKIQRASADGSQIEDIVQEWYIHYSTPLAIDPAVGNVFWFHGYFSAVIRSVELVSLNFRSIIGGLSEPGGLAVDSGNAKIYWSTNSFNDNKIWRADLNGSNVEEFLTTYPRASGLAVLPTPHVFSSVPKYFSIDPGQPHELEDPLMGLGLHEVHLVFSSSTTCDAASDYVLSERGGDGVAPNILGVAFLASDACRVTLDSAIEPGAWTCIHHRPSGTKTCVGSLPGDVDVDGVSRPSDVAALRICLDSGGTCLSSQCDLDRSGRCNPQDLLREVDVLLGANAFESWNGAVLRECP